MSYVEFPITHVALNDLALDLDNYRIPTRRDDEAAALFYLFSSEDALGAARLILREGYFDNEVPIVVVESSTFVVLEGNRRVSALKALRDPALVPSMESDIRALLNRYAVEAEALPGTIRVFVSPDRATAAPHIARMHTGLPKRPWTRDQQATFYYSLLEPKTTVHDIKAMYPDVEMSRFMRMAVVRRMLSTVPFGDSSIGAHAISDDLKMSVFEYAYRNKDIAAAIGVQFDGHGFLVPGNRTPEELGKSLPPGRVRALEHLLDRFNRNKLDPQKLDTRSREFQRNTDERDRLVATLNEIAEGRTQKSNSDTTKTDDQPGKGQQSKASRPNGDSGNQSARGTGDSGSETGATPNSESSPGGSTTPPRGPNHPQTRDKLDLSGMSYDSTPVNLKLRYQELRKISLSDLPIAAAILLRSVLESTIKVHFESTPTPAKGELSVVFGLVESTYGKEKALQSSIQHVRSGGGNRPGSIQWFNLVAHSADAAVTANDVREAWSRLNPLVRRLLRPA